MTEPKDLPRNHVLAVVDGSDAAASTIIEPISALQRTSPRATTASSR